MLSYGKKMKIFKIYLIFLLSILVGKEAYCQSPKRIISLSPATTEVLFAFGLEQEIVAVTTFCNYPEKALSKEKIGAFSSPNIEKIILLSPDYIFASGIEQMPVVSRLRKLNFNVYVYEPKNLNEMFNGMLEIGKLTNRTKEAQNLVSSINMRLQDIEDKLSNYPEMKHPKIFVEIWNEPLMTAGKDSFIDSIIEMAGGENIAYDAPRSYSQFSSELIIERNPDVILLAYMVKDKNTDIYNRVGWEGINAIKNKKVIILDNPDIFLRQGPRIIDAIELLHKELYEK